MTDDERNKRLTEIIDKLIDRIDTEAQYGSTEDLDHLTFSLSNVTSAYESMPYGMRRDG